LYFKIIGLWLFAGGFMSHLIIANLFANTLVNPLPGRI
jgi:hypothetical protein